MAEILEALGLNKAEAARRMGVSRPTLYDVLRGDRPLTVEVALRFGRLAGTSPDVLVRMQAEVDLWDERERLAAELAKIKSARKDEAA